MPLMILGAVVTALVASYIYLLNNKDRFVKKKEPLKGPFNIIYLPADLNAGKNNGADTERDGRRE